MSTQPFSSEERDFIVEVVNETTLQLSALPFIPELKEFLSITVRRDSSGIGLTPQVVAVYTPESHVFAFGPTALTLQINGADFRHKDQITVLLKRRPLPGAMEIPVAHRLDLNEALRQRSGVVCIESRLVAFLYHLLRDHLPAGVVEELVRETTEAEETGLYSNGYLARYAEDIAKRLLDQPNMAKTLEVEEIS